MAKETVWTAASTIFVDGEERSRSVASLEIK
jgi:hypothetical protein